MVCLGYSSNLRWERLCQLVQPFYPKSVNFIVADKPSRQQLQLWVDSDGYWDTIRELRPSVRIVRSRQAMVYCAVYNGRVVGREWLHPFIQCVPISKWKQNSFQKAKHAQYTDCHRWDGQRIAKLSHQVCGAMFPANSKDCLFQSVHFVFFLSLSLFRSQ